MLTVGTVVWLASEVMFFSGLFAAYFTLRATTTGPWPPPDVHLGTATSALFTTVLVASSGTMQMAVRAISGGDRRRFRWWIVATAALGLMFVANQAREWSVLDFGPDSHAFGSAFYVMTGFHGMHVLGGMAAMIVLAARASRAGFGAAEAPAVEVVSYYWHFVDVVWVAMWSTLFLLR